jgi:DNA mitochondrial polymerase exonuclease domain
LLGKCAEALPDLDFPLPAIHGNISDHLKILGTEQEIDYYAKAQRLTEINLPKRPERWEPIAGWVRYKDGKFEQIKVLIFNSGATKG